MFWKFVICMYKSHSSWDEGLRTLSVQNDYSHGLIWKQCVKEYKSIHQKSTGFQVSMGFAKRNVPEICHLSKALMIPVLWSRTQMTQWVETIAGSMSFILHLLSIQTPPEPLPRAMSFCQAQTYLTTVVGAQPWIEITSQMSSSSV